MFKTNLLSKFFTIEKIVIILSIGKTIIMDSFWCSDEEDYEYSESCGIFKTDPFDIAFRLGRPSAPSSRCYQPSQIPNEVDTKTFGMP